MCGAKPLSRGCWCGSWSFAVPAWDELDGGRGHLQEDFVCGLANVGGNGEKTSEKTFQPMGQTQSEGWDGLGVDTGNVSSRGMGSLSLPLAEKCSPAARPCPAWPGCGSGGCSRVFWVSGVVPHSSVGLFAKYSVGLCFLTHPIIAANTNLSLVPTLLHHVSIYCQWP